MIRERVSITGIIRPLEAEQDLPALQIVPEFLGTICERWIHRYVASTEHCEKKFASRIKNVAKRRERAIVKLRQSTQSRSSSSEDKEKVSVSQTGWSLAWALEADERPPPSSLVARRDTAEALALATRGRCRPARGNQGRAGIVGAFDKRHDLGSDTDPPRAAVAVA